MTTLTITFDFASNDGTAEQFVEIITTGAWPDGSYDGAEGNPAGSVTFAVSYSFPDGQNSQKAISQSFSDWGIPAGATIVSVGNLQGEVKADIVSDALDVWPGVSLQIGIDGTKYIQYLYPNSATSTSFGWTAVTPLQIDTDQSPYALTDILTLALDLYGYAPTAGDAITQWYDNISFDIVYTGGDVVLTGNGSQRKQEGAGTLTFPDVFLHGVGTQRRQEGAGTLSFTDVAVRLIGHGTQRRAIGYGGLSLDDSILIYGSGTQRRQSGIGTLFSPIVGEAETLLDAGIHFELVIDGTEYPLIGAIIQRHRNYEKASVMIPGQMTWAILASIPVNLEINLIRSRFDGTGIETITLFTGISDNTLASLNGMTGELIANGSAIYPTRENRRLSGSPSYVRDSANQVAVRGQIDPYLVPGDVLRFRDIREIAVSKVVYNINPNLMFMEASSGI